MRLIQTAVLSFCLAAAIPAFAGMGGGLTLLPVNGYRKVESL
jgi:hypothetical protein